MSSQLEPGLFRRACSLFATGIAIITTKDSVGIPHGMTVNSFASVSLNPPLVLFCLDERAALLSHIAPNRSIAINLLAEEQADHSSRFARKSEDRFENLDWKTGTLGSPLLAGALANFECTVTQLIPAGDHQIVLAHVHSVEWREGRPLLYFASAYESVA